MEKILELKEEINSLSNEELLSNFNSKPSKYGELNYFPVFAIRINNFKDLIFKEVIAERNTKINVRTFKHSWFIAIAVLDYCENDIIKKQLADHVKANWSKSDYDFFINYIKTEKKLIKYFK